jgi:hypothetical protein
LESLRLKLNQAKVRSTTQRRGKSVKPLVSSLLLTTLHIHAVNLAIHQAGFITLYLLHPIFKAPYNNDNMLNLQLSESESGQQQWRSIYKLAGTLTVITLAGILADVIIGNSTGGDLTALPQTAIDRFEQFQADPLLGLYHLDLLNLINQVLLIPVYFALYGAHRKIENAYAALAFLIFLVGSILFIATNTALPMLELSKKYTAASSESQKLLYAAAGEAMLARGAHGSAGVFIGFLLPNVAGILLSWVMLKAGIFSKLTAFFGLAGSILLVLYLILVTFVPEAKNMATALAMPGGLMAMAWMVLFSVRLFHLGRKSTPELV